MHMAIPKPGKSVRGSKSGAPIMALFDLLGRRWAMGIIWQLSEGPLPFLELQKRCQNISPTILSGRTKDLCEALLVERTLDGYRLTEQGEELFRILSPFKEWSVGWAKQFKNNI
jgi:DNA-binding HxlR family transcriptional regulator